MQVAGRSRESTPTCSGFAFALVASIALSLACASTGGPARDSKPAAPPRIARPEAPPEYDVLVAEFASSEGKLEEARAAYARAAAKDPDSAYLERQLAHLAAQLDDADAAAAHATRAVELDPDDAESRLFLGRLSRMRRDLPGAEAALRDASGQPVSPNAALLLFQVYLDRDRLPEALEVSQQLVDEHPDVLGGHMGLATVYERMGRGEDAERTLREALEHHPGRFVLYGRLARLRRAAGDRAGEIEIYREVLRDQPQHYGTLVSLAEALVTAGELDAAIETYETLVETYPTDLQSLRRLASLEYSAGRAQQALQRLEKAFERNPEHIAFAYWIGQLRLSMGDEEAALADFERIPDTHAMYPEARMQVAAILESRRDYAGALVEVERVNAVRPSRALSFHLAALYGRAGDFDRGLALLEAMLEEKPDDSEVLYQIGVLYGTAKRVDDSLRYMRASLEQDANNPHALNYIGYTFAERGENLDEAERLILQALEQRPNDGYITDSLAWVYYMRARPLMDSGDADGGRRLLEQAREKLFIAAELTGGDPVVSEHLGDVYLLLDEKERALEYYKQAVTQEHREDEQPQLIEKLESLQRELGRQ